MSNDDSNISRELHNIYWASRWQTLTVSGTVHLLPMRPTFLWMRESYFRHGRVFVVALPALWYRDVSHVSHLCPAKYFHHRMCAGACLGVGIPPGNVGGDWRGSGTAIYWILEIMGLRSVWEHIGVVSRGWGQHRSDIRPSSSHPSHPWARPGSVLFCIIIIIIITRLSHRPASSAGVTGPREPVPKQYQENKSEDQL